LYEGSEGKIGLKKETDTLKQYIELHLLRKPLSQNIDFYAEGNQNEWYIVPMLLINFVENAFKHSNMDNNEMAWIKINSSVNEEGMLHFLIENSVFSSNLPSEASGIGLQNVKRQLELNYPNQYQLNIKQEKEIFSVALNVQLAKR
jgi:LytS/YehU family sensor histidine kinase